MKKDKHIKNVHKIINDGNTIPFINLQKLKNRFLSAEKKRIIPVFSRLNIHTAFTKKEVDVMKIFALKKSNKYNIYRNTFYRDIRERLFLLLNDLENYVFKYLEEI